VERRWRGGGEEGERRRTKTIQRLYVLGVGPSVDRYAVQQLAKKANGVSEVLLATEKDVSGTLERFRRYIRGGREGRRERERK
jgi:hypothetical protein